MLQSHPKHQLRVQFECHFWIFFSIFMNMWQKLPLFMAPNQDISSIESGPVVSGVLSDIKSGKEGENQPLKVTQLSSIIF